MQKWITVLFISMGMGTVVLADSGITEPRYAIAIHAGAGTIRRENLSAEQEQHLQQQLQRALKAGYAELQAGASAESAVISAIKTLEDMPEFNAGKGAVFNARGEHELDASLMLGHNREAGAIAGVRGIQNPIELAQLVLHESPHVMLSGTGAEEFAVLHHVKTQPPEYFYTDYRWDQLQKAKKSSSSVYRHPVEQLYSTVGAVALDRQGNIAAGTSTGGMTNKQFGRVGDSPIIGAGTYADNRSCAVSATGHGEYFIRIGVAQAICDRVHLLGESVQDAADEVIQQELTGLGGTGGVIVLDADGEIAFSFNTPGMYRGSISADGQMTTAIFKD